MRRIVVEVERLKEVDIRREDVLRRHRFVELVKLFGRRKGRVRESWDDGGMIEKERVDIWEDRIEGNDASAEEVEVVDAQRL